MKGDVQKKYFIGDNKPGIWSSVYAYKPHNPEFLKKRGEIFAAVTLTGPTTFNVATAGNLLLDHLHETYFENQGDTVLMALEKAILSINKHLQKLLENDDAAETGIDIELTTMVLHNDIACFASTGSGHVYLFRDGNITEISSALKDPSGEGLVKVASLVMKRNDVFVLGTPEIADEFGTEELLEVTSEFTDQPLKKKAYETAAKIALILVGFQVDRAEAKAEVLLQKEHTHEIKAEEERVQGMQQEVIRESGEPGAEEALAEEDMQEMDDQQPQYIETAARVTGEPKNFQEKIAGAFAGLKLKAGSYKAQLNRKRSAKTAGLTGEVGSQVDYQQPTYKVILQKVRIQLAKAGQLLKQVVWNGWLNMGGKENLYLKGAGSRRNWRFIIVVIVVVACVLYFSLKSITEHNQLLALENEARRHLETAREQIEEVDKVAEVIAKSKDSTERKAQMLGKLSEASKELAQAGDVDQFKSDVDELNGRVLGLTDLLNNTIAVNDPRLLFDIGGMFPGAEATDLAAAGGSIYLSDSTYGKIYQTDYAGANLREVVAGLTKPRTITIDDAGDVVVLDEDGEKRLATVSVKDGSVNRHSGTSEFRVGNVPQIEFANIFGGRVYGIDKSIKAVIALQRSGSGYGIPEKRFELEELSTGKDVQVSDLKIYLLANVKQGLYRSLNNKDDTPVLTGLAEGEDLFAATALYVNELYVFIADPAKQRILVFNKDVSELTLKAQYVYKGEGGKFKNIKEIVADRERGKLFVLDGTAVYELQLNQLDQF